MNRFAKVAFVALAALLAGAPGRLNALVVMSESFRNSTATNWTIIGNATLTSGVAPDPSGAGWLRLTSATNAQAGSAIFNTPFASADGAQITFTYATWGGNGADGISFYLIDGATTTPTVGGAGSGLGYSRTSTPANGVTNGYLGVGLDEYGNFATNSAGDCNALPCPAGTPNMVTIRGSGSLGTGFNYLTRQGATIGTTDRAGAKRVRITVSPGPTVTITVDVDSGSGFVNVISSFTVSSATGQIALPTTFKMGLSASTGGSNNNHEIRDLNLNGARPSSTALSSSGSPSGEGQTVTFTATVTGTGGSPTGTVTFRDGTTVIGTCLLYTSPSPRD